MRWESAFMVLMAYSDVNHRPVLTRLSTAYFVGMGLPDEEASKLHHRYYSQYGLAIRGLVRHHQIGVLVSFLTCELLLSPKCRSSRL